MDKDADYKIKKYVETYFSQYQELVTTHKDKNRTKLEEWLQQSSSPSSIL